jgi:chemotaxis protein MotB
LVLGAGLGCGAKSGAGGLSDPAVLERRLQASEQARRDAQAANDRQGEEMRAEIDRLRQQTESARAESLRRETEASALLTDAQAEIERLSQDLKAAQDGTFAGGPGMEAEIALKQVERALGPMGAVLGLETDFTREDGRPALLMSGDRLFERGTVNLREEVKAPLGALAAQLAPLVIDWRFAVAGHADAAPIKNLPYKDNTELSFHRALAVARLFAETDPSLAMSLEVRALGERAPRAPNDSPPGRAANRRVEIIPIARPGSSESETDEPFALEEAPSS